MGAITVIIVAAGILSALLLAAWMLAGYVIARRSPDPRHTPDQLGLEYEKIHFLSRDGLTLNGRLTGPIDRPLIVFCAGMFGSMDGDTAMLCPFVEAGFSILQFDWRAHGGSEGQTGTVGVREVDDLKGAIDFLAERGITRIGVLGFSFGGAVAMRAAAEDQRIRCLVVDGGFVDLKHAFQGLIEERAGRLAAALAGPLFQLALMVVGWRVGADLRVISPVEAAPHISPRPLLLIQGADDPIVPRADQDAIFAACHEPKILWRVEGCGHREVHEKHPDEYFNRVIGFFRETL